MKVCHRSRRSPVQQLRLRHPTYCSAPMAARAALPLPPSSPSRLPATRTVAAHLTHRCSAAHERDYYAAKLPASCFHESWPTCLLHDAHLLCSVDGARQRAWRHRRERLRQLTRTLCAIRDRQRHSSHVCEHQPGNPPSALSRMMSMSILDSGECSLRSTRQTLLQHRKTEHGFHRSSQRRWRLGLRSALILTMLDTRCPTRPRPGPGRCGRAGCGRAG